jgi:zinc transporter ZupT
LLFYQAVLSEFVLAIVIILGIHLDIFNLALVHSEVLRKFNHLIFTVLQSLTSGCSLVALQYVCLASFQDVHNHDTVVQVASLYRDVGLLLG